MYFYGKTKNLFHFGDPASLFLHFRSFFLVGPRNKNPKQESNRKETIVWVRVCRFTW